ncbi:MAG: radical SAM/SPASM domain-containing protein [Opitutales bacterium]
MKLRQPEFDADEKRVHRAYQSGLEANHWLDFPMIVSIETYSKCNAACSFCPYTELERHGARLAPEKVKSLLDQVAAFEVHPERLTLCRVNEPLLDRRIFDYLEYAQSVLPTTTLCLFSNGQALTPEVIERLNHIKQFKNLNVSFNEHDPEIYHKVMGLDYSKTLPRLDALFSQREAGELNFGLSISRVGTSDAQDDAFLDWCRQRWPGVPAQSLARMTWVGTETGEIVQAPRAGCTQWFSLHVLADGSCAFCCIDGFGSGTPQHVDEHTLLEIYNTPAKRRMRERETFRTEVEGCAQCVHGMSSGAYGRA